jgi:predicted heme/steroid binding protein
MSPPPAEFKFQVGPITERSLAYYNGRDWAKPLLIAVQGTVYDVTDAMDTYGPGGGGAWVKRRQAAGSAGVAAGAS